MTGFTLIWPFPPPEGPTPWTPEQVRDYQRQQEEQTRQSAPPAPW
jgi:hypothetical protein